MRETVRPDFREELDDAEPRLQECAALLELSLLPGISDRRILKLRNEFGSGRAALRAPAHAFRRLVGGPARESRRDPKARQQVREALDRCQKLGIRTVPIGSRAYPTRLNDLHDPPPVLFLRGEISLLEKDAVAVVGSRKATAYGRRTAEAIGRSLAAHGVVVVSGLALGIDGAAHRGALYARGGTIGVLGSGADRPHPPSHTRLFDKIGREGLLLSEFLPRTPPLPHHFPRRNRIIAALSRCVVVVEAAARSGALITMDHALDLGRDIFAVPGSLESPNSRGTNAMIRDGAGIVVSPEAVVDDLSWLTPSLETARREGPRPVSFSDRDQERIWRVLESRTCHIDSLARAAGLKPARTLAALAALEMNGLVVQHPGMRFARTAGHALATNR